MLLFVRYVAIYWQYRDNNINRTHRALTYIDINWLMQGHRRGIKGRILIYILYTEAREFLNVVSLSFLHCFSVKILFNFQKCPSRRKSVCEWWQKSLEEFYIFQAFVRNMKGVQFVRSSICRRSHPTKEIYGLSQVQIAANIWNNRVVCNNNPHLYNARGYFGGQNKKIKKTLSA